MTRSPRESFQLTPAAAEWKKIIASSAAVETACEYALLEAVSEINDPMNPTGLAQIIGARRALSLLLNIHEPVKEPKAPERRTLHYKTPNP